MRPGQLTYADIYVEAPSDAREGDVSLLEVRISDAVGKGMEVFQIPVRVVGSSSYELKSSGDWFISSNGGYPLAWIENTGNDMPQIGLQISDLPEGWIAEVDTPVEFSPGEIKGLPINLIPPSDWNGDGFDVTVQVSHPNLAPETVTLSVQSSNISFSSSPVLWSSWYMQAVDIFNSGSNEIDENSAAVSVRLHVLNSIRSQHINLTSGEDRIELVLIGKESPQMSVSCSFINGAFNELESCNHFRCRYL